MSLLFTFSEAGKSRLLQIPRLLRACILVLFCCCHKYHDQSILKTFCLAYSSASQFITEVNQNNRSRQKVWKLLPAGSLEVLHRTSNFCAARFHKPRYGATFSGRHILPPASHQSSVMTVPCRYIHSQSLLGESRHVTYIAVALKKRDRDGGTRCVFLERLLIPLVFHLHELVGS